MKKLLVLTIALGLFAAPTVRAEDESGRHPKPHHPKADRNNDGVVDETEKTRAEEMRQKWSERKEQADANQDGKVDKVERKQAKKEWLQEHPEARKNFAHKKDRDNNPPGPKGGAGTNWENPPGPKGGPGKSPDHGKKKH